MQAPTWVTTLTTVLAQDGTMIKVVWHALSQRRQRTTTTVSPNRAAFVGRRADCAFKILVAGALCARTSRRPTPAP